MRAWLIVLGLLLAACGPREAPPPPVPPARRTPIVVDAAGFDAGPPVRPGLRLPAGVTPLAYDVRLEVDPEKESFAGRVEIRVRLDAATTVVWLHAVDLEIASARIRSGTTSEVAIPTARTAEQMIGLQVGRPVGPGEVVIALTYTGHTSRDQEGLFRQSVGGQWFLFSQGQSVLARRIFVRPGASSPARRDRTRQAVPELAARCRARRRARAAHHALCHVARDPRSAAAVDGAAVGERSAPTGCGGWPAV